MKPEGLIVFSLMFVFLIVMCVYGAVRMAQGDLPDTLKDIIIWIVATNLVGLSYVGCAVLPEGWVHAICIAVAMIYAIGTLGFGLLFLPSMILAGWIKLGFYFFDKFRNVEKLK